jgi:hypothetical protein
VTAKPLPFFIVTNSNHIASKLGESRAVIQAVQAWYDIALVRQRLAKKVNGLGLD